MARKKKKLVSISESTAGDLLRNSDWIKHLSGYRESEMEAHRLAMKMHKDELKAEAAK